MSRKYQCIFSMTIPDDETRFYDNTLQIILIMKRRQLLKLLGLSPAFAGISCIKEFPSAPTVITGEVIDEAGLPVSGVLFVLRGKKKSGLSTVPIFEEISVSGSNGKYLIEKIIPNASKLTEFVPTNNEFYNFGITHSMLLKIDDQYVLLGNSIPIVPDKYGKTSFYQFKIVKK